MIQQQISPELSRRLARIGNTPLAQIYFDIGAKYLEDAINACMEGDTDTPPEYTWFIRACDRSGEIAVSLKTAHDYERILNRLLADIPATNANNIRGHIKAAPSNFVLDLAKIKGL
jgi:hypothetical protein